MSLMNNENMFHIEILKEKHGLQWPLHRNIPQVKKSSWWEFCRLRHTFPQIWYMNLQLKPSNFLLLKANMSDLRFTQTSHLPRIHPNIQHNRSVLYGYGHAVCDAHLYLLQKTLEKLRARLKPWRCDVCYCCLCSDFKMSSTFICMSICCVF